MTDRYFWQMVQAKWQERKFVCVGLDSDFKQISQEIVNQLFWPFESRRGLYGVIFGFNKAIINATHDLVCAYKPNIAFYEAYGPAGLLALIDTVRYIQAKAPTVPIILDAKRADIDNANNAYTRAVFDIYGADAVTVNPYLGSRTMQPFLERREKGIFVLCRTSNDGADEFQDLMLYLRDLPGEAEEFFANLWGVKKDSLDMVHSRIALYRYIAYRAATQWNKNNNCALVVGATYPKELAEVRQTVGDMPILIPGIGTQGGDLEKTIQAGKKNIIINASRSIIFASQGPDFAEAARRETLKLHKMINKYLRGG